MKGKAHKRTLRAICVFTALLMAFQLIGCGDNAEDKPGETDAPVRQEAIWQGESFGEIVSVTEGSPVYLVEYQEGIENLPDLSGEDFNSNRFQYLGCYQDKIYLLTTCTNSEWAKQEDGSLTLLISSQKYFISTYDLNTKVPTCEEITFDFSPWGGAVTGDGELVFFNLVSNEEVVEHYYAVYMDLSGTVRTMLDLYPAMLEYGLELTPNLLFDCVDYDSRGYLYVRDQKKPSVGVIDESGALLDTMEISLERADAALCAMKTRDGAAVFAATGIKGTEKVTTLFWYDDEKPGISILGDIGFGGEIAASLRYMNQYEEIYYSTGSNLIRWNWKTGVREKIFNCSANGIGTNYSQKYCVTNEDGQLFLLDLYGSTAQLYSFSETEPVYEGIIRIADIYSIQADEFIQSCAAGFSRKNPLYHVGYELADRDRIINEIVSGNGPEMLIMDREDMETLYEKGVLVDLSDVLPAETQEQIFSCVLEAGRIDGKLIGLADGASGWTLYVSKDVWQKDTWSVEEFVNLVESKEGELDDIIVGQSPGSQTPSSIFNSIVLMDLKNSPFIDWENGKCYFDGPLFRRVLELAMRYGKPVDSSYNYMTDIDAFEAAAVREIKEGRALAYEGHGIGSINMFSQEMAKLGDDFFSVGFPTGERSGAFCGTNSFLVVNARAENMDAIYYFLRHCYDYDTQRTDHANVRKDVTREFVVQEYDGHWAYSEGGGVFLMLESKPNGDSWLEEYLECMDECVPRPMKSSDVWSMIREEMAYYFDGVRDMDQTIDILQRRVQLYLDEHKM